MGKEMTFTVNDFIDAVRAHTDNVQDLRYDWKDNGFNLNVGLVKVDSAWGDEGEGEEAGFTLRHVESGRLFLLQGYYASYDVFYFDEFDFQEVEKKPVTVYRYLSLDGKRTYGVDL